MSAFAITIVIFLVGFIIGSAINEKKLQVIYDLENDIRVESLGNELVFELVSSDLCENINITSYTTEISELGKRLTYMESIYGYDSPQVHNLKNYYTLLQIRHYLINKDMQETCGIDKPIVLYFYTNFGDCVDCGDQGLVLTNVHRQYPQFNIYSFEFAENNPAIEFLKEKYVLEEHRLPTVIIDNEVNYGFQSRDFLIETMNLEERQALAEEKDNPDNPILGDSEGNVFMNFTEN